MARPMPLVSPCAPWLCRGTSPPTGLARAATTRLVALRATTSMASSITPTGSTIYSSPPPWEGENYEPRNPMESGFMNRKNDLHPFIFEQSVHTEVVIACFEEFSKTLKKNTVVVMDNASVHTSEEFEECLPKWKKKGLLIKYLTTYSPELNLIEILWRNIKYAWLPFSAYQCLNALRDALENILKNFGSKYQITFA